jgi:hypothetical protein
VNARAIRRRATSDSQKFGNIFQATPPVESLEGHSTSYPNHNSERGGGLEGEGSTFALDVEARVERCLEEDVTAAVRVAGSAGEVIARQESL